MSLPGVILGLINIALVVVILCIVGLIIVWFLKWFLSVDVPEQIKKLYVAGVGLYALYMLVALIFGSPTWRIVQAGAHLLA